MKYPRFALFSLFTVYLVWGSTFLAMRVAVQEGSGFSPFWVGSTRFTLAGFILLAICVILKKQIQINGKEFLVLALSANLIWTFGHGLYLWAEQYVESSYAALVTGFIPIFTALFQVILDKKRISKLLVVSILSSMTGLFFLVKHSFNSGTEFVLVPSLFMLLGAFNWALGTIIQKRVKIRQSILTSAAYQQIFAAIGFWIVALILKEPVPSPTSEALWAWAYLLVFGSFIAFSCYVAAVRHLPENISTTFAYICPIIAVILGWLILNEAITLYKVIGMIFILLGVIGIFRDQKTQPH